MTFYCVSPSAAPARSAASDDGDLCNPSFVCVREGMGACSCDVRIERGEGDPKNTVVEGKDSSQISTLCIQIVWTLHMKGPTRHSMAVSVTREVHELGEKQ